MTALFGREPDDESEQQPDRRLLRAGQAASTLIADPKSWINRRVETVELLSREETRRRVSIDFSLSDAQLSGLWVEDEGVVVPISALSKERRRTFDLSDEGGSAVPVLGLQPSRDLTLQALARAASAALPEHIGEKQFAALIADLRKLVSLPPAAGPREPDPAGDDSPPETAKTVYEDLTLRATVDGSLEQQLYANTAFWSLLDSLWGNYVLFAVLARGGPNRRILKYAYAEELDLSPSKSREGRKARRWPTTSELALRLRYPDRRDFDIPCPGAWRAKSFHLEIVIPEELRFRDAVLQDFDDPDCRDLSANEHDVNRATLYATDGVEPEQDVFAVVQISPERAGRISQASLTSVVVAVLLWLGALSGLEIESPEATVALVLGGAALYAGITAALGESRLVSMIFKTTRRWLTVVTLAALAGSASLALEVPSAHPVAVWIVAAAVCTIAAARLSWSSLRASA